MTILDDVFGPWLERLRADIGDLELFDAHTHVGRNDPDGFKQDPAQLLEDLAPAGARALVFPMHEPDGYGAANDEVVRAAAASGGRLVALCRVDPERDAVAEATRALDAGARGIKLHPRAERFTLSHPVVRDLVALADERRLPVMIHAGRGIPALGEDTVRLSGEFRGARLILAHAAISDLAWLWRELPEHPNVFVDTSWWNPTDLVALLTLAPPGQVLFASDSPYGRPVASAVNTLRSALQAGLTPDQVRVVAGGQLERLAAGEDPVDAGPPPGTPRPLHPLLERVVVTLATSIAQMFVQADNSENLALARLACAVGDDTECAAVCSAVLELIELYEQHVAPPDGGSPIPWASRFLVSALFVARTPDVPLPALPDAPEPERAEIRP